MSELAHILFYLIFSGTAFEYLMPNLIMDIPEGSLIDESCEFAKEIQKKYANRMQVPWGISESAYCLKDLQGNYQYKASLMMRHICLNWLIFFFI